MTDSEFATHVERWTNFMEHTQEYREDLCGKLDKIQERLAGLPCEITILKLKEIDKLRDFAGRSIFWLVTSLLVLAVAWGALLTRVEITTKRLDRMENNGDK